MKKIFTVLVVALLMIENSYAGNYSLPAGLGSAPFNCTGSGPVYSCGNDIDIEQDSTVTLSANITLNINGDLKIKKDFLVVANGFAFNLNVSGKVDIDKGVNFTGNIDASGEVKIDKDAIFVGNISSDDKIDLKKDGHFTGNISTPGQLKIDKDTFVYGMCDPPHPSCTDGSIDRCDAISVIQSGYGGTQIKIENSATNNGVDMTNGTYSGNAVLGVGAITPTTGNGSGLPGLVPSSLPANNASNNLTLSNGQVIDAQTDVYYKDVNIKNNNSASFTGGGPFHFNKLKIEDDATLNIAAGIYYIDEFELKDNGTLNITSEPVIFYIGKKFKVKDDGEVSTPGITSFRVNMLQGSDEVKFEGNATFTGLVYAPYGTKIELKDDVQVNAQLATSGELKLKDDAALTFSEDDLTSILDSYGCDYGPVVDHFVINVGGGAASTCSAFPFTITAEDSSNNTLTGYTGSVSITTSTGHGNFSVVSATNPTVPGTDADDNGSVGYTFDALDNGQLNLTLANDHAETLTISVNDASVPVTSTSTPVTFSENAFTITDIDSMTIENIPVVGRDHAYRVQMERKDPSTGLCGPASTYSGAKPLRLWRSKHVNDPASTIDPVFAGSALPASEPGMNNGSITFSGGQATVVMNSSDIGKFTIEIKEVPVPGSFSDAVIAGTSALQTVRPFGLAIKNLQGTNANPGASVPGGLVFTTAGANFSATVEAVAWDTNDDTNNDGLLDAGSYNDNVKIPNFAWNTLLDSVAGGFVPGPGDLLRAASTVVTLTQAEFQDNSNPSKGTVTVNDLRYSEVGSFTLKGDALNFLGTSGANIESNQIVVGRFIPASFAISNVQPGSLQNTCEIPLYNGFIYSGEDFGYLVNPSFRVSAMNALPVPTTTINYTGAWAKLTAASSYSIANVTLDSSNPGSDSNLLDIVHTRTLVDQVDNGDGSFDITFGADTFCYGLDTGSGCIKQANSIVAEFLPDIDVTLATVSDGEVSSTVSQVFTPDGTANPVRSGRLVMGNTFGSELVALNMPVTIEYYTGSGFINNTDDHCSSINDIDVKIFTSTLTGGSSAPTVTPMTANEGKLNIELSAPGAGNTGEILWYTDLIQSAQPWLQYDWDGNGILEDPFAKATYGIYSGNSRQIYYRQIYQ